MGKESRTNSTCRVCLRFGSKVMKNCKSVFETRKNTTILDNIILIADVKIEEGDGLPSKICAECLSELDAAINFKIKCERSNKSLHSGNVDKSKNNQALIDVPLPIIQMVKKEFSSESVCEKSEFNKDAAESDELVKTEDTSEEDLNYEGIDYYDDAAASDSEVKAESDSEIKPKILDTDSEEALEHKLELQIKSQDDNAASESPVPVAKKSRAIDLKLECHDCGGLFKSKCKLKMHWKKVHMLEKLICNSCKRTFKCFKTLNKHLKIRPSSCTLAGQSRIEGVGKLRVYYCKKCDYQTKKFYYFKRHLVIHTGERRFMCDLCSKAFSQLGSLNAHRESVHKIILKEITCQYCGELVQGHNKIRKHIMKHVETPVQCDICKKMYKSKQILVNHLYRHTGKKSFTCKKCGKAFVDQSGLSNHNRIAHSSTGRKYYTCDICGFKVLKKTYMNKHKIKHTNSNVGCGTCGRFYRNAEDLASHSKVHTKEASICLQCNRVFSNERSLKRHKIETHKHKNNSSKQKCRSILDDTNSSSLENCEDEKVKVEIISNI